MNKPEYLANAELSIKNFAISLSARAASIAKMRKCHEGQSRIYYGFFKLRLGNLFHFFSS